MRLLRFLGLLAAVTLPVVAVIALSIFAPLTTHIVYGVLVTIVGTGLLLRLLWAMAGEE